MSGERTKYEERWKRLPEKDAAKARAERSTQTYTKGNTGQTVNAEKNTKSVADKRKRDFEAYMETTGKAKPSKRVMEKWLKGEKDAYKKAQGLPTNAKPKTKDVMEWLKTERMPKAP